MPSRNLNLWTFASWWSRHRITTLDITLMTLKIPAHFLIMEILNFIVDFLLLQLRGQQYGVPFQCHRNGKVYGSEANDYLQSASSTPRNGFLNKVRLYLSSRLVKNQSSAEFWIYYVVHTCSCACTLHESLAAGYFTLSGLI